MVFLAYKECAYFLVALEGDSLQGICHPERSEVGYVILSAAKDLCVRHARPLAALEGDSLQGICHPERSEGSRADLWGITRATDC